ncbi:uncharacterized protein LOC101449579 isoform X2 [Ceratitis capitata]|uniref:uncharacterized protein LOC101449579 isoform X2 n=1 Tax=Ceratitis capitata TaxID=7213 RepID=UPI000A108D7E|nr:uncharacterized protein LOC101449579 isoform X2 [Ceratitis capitata]
MAPRESIFSNLPPSISEVTKAIEKIEVLVAAKKLKSKLFYDMLFGFRVLEEAMQNEQTEAFNLVIKWLDLFLKIQTNISSQNDVIHSQFEKVIPSAVTYIIGCLQYKAKGVISYHYQLLEMIHELLNKARPEVLEKLATFETGVIACVWFPIGFVGDFNTQMMALRLLAMLLKCVDAARLQNELDSIRCADKSILKNKLTAAIAVANFHTAKFENTARDLLNTYNMHLAQNILVYSFRCKTFKFENNIEFFKPMNAESFWLDLNYCPRTLSFHGQCKTSRNSGYRNCSVSLQITKLSLNLNLTVEFQAPIKFTAESRYFPNLSNLTAAKITLPRDESMRLMENKYILRYFNEFQRSISPNRSMSIIKLHDTSTPVQLASLTDEPIADEASPSAIDKPSFGTNKDYSNIEDIENKENVPPTDTNRNRPGTDNTNSNMISKQFQKSYELLIGDRHESNFLCKVKSKVENKNNNQTIALTSMQAAATPTTNIDKEVNNETPKNNKMTRNTRRKIVNYSTSTSESQLTSQNFKQPQKRFFKTQISNSDCEYVPYKTKRVYRKHKHRATKEKTPKAATIKSKIVNEVKPMLNSSKEFDKLAGDFSDNHAPRATAIISNERKMNGTIIDLTDTCLSDLTTNIYENLVVSDAEPGKSYRNFTLRRNPIDFENAVVEKQRSRKALKRSVKEDNPPEIRPQTLCAQVKSVTKRSRNIFDAIKREKISPPKIKKTVTTLSNEIEIAYPADVNICTSSNQKFSDDVLRSCTSTKLRNIPKQILSKNQNSIKELPITEPNVNEVPTTYFQTFENTFTNNKENENNIPYNSSKTTVVGKLNEGLSDDIQVCRRDVTQNNISNVNDYDEFSDYPTFSPLIDVSNMMISSDCESAPDVTVETSRLTSTNNNLLTTPTQEMSPDPPFQIREAKKLNPQKSVIYCSRSESDSDSDKECTTISNKVPEVRSMQPLELSKHVFLTPKLPLQNFRQTTSVTKCQITTTATSIITHQDHVIHQQNFIVNLDTSSDTPLNLSKSCSRATTSTTTTTKTIVEEKQELNISNSNQNHMNITAPTPEVLKHESSNMIANYKSNLNLHLNQIEENIYIKPATAYIEKICDIGESMMNEIECERKSLLELEANTERLSRQLGWQYEAFREKTQQYKCFKQNIDALLSVISNIKLSDEIESETRHKIQQLQQASESLCTQQWRNFVNETTENLLKDISRLSNL